MRVPAFVLSNGSICGESNGISCTLRNDKCKLRLFDLDGTLLQSDKTISKRTLSVLMQCREKGILIRVSTSRSEQNSLVYLYRFFEFTKCSLKMCVEILNKTKLTS